MSAAEPPLVIVEDLVKTYDDKVVLDRVSLHVDRGETLVVVGGSGAGKSTLIRQILGLEKPDSGRVVIDGVDIFSLGEVALLKARHTFALVFQNGALLDSMSVFDNVAFGLRVKPRKLRPTEAVIKRKVHDLLNLVQLDWLADRFPSQLSGGQRQRVAIARALVTNPRILILDEATSALDYESERIVQNNMRSIVKGRTVIIIAHRLAAVRPCDIIVGMHKGEIVEAGTHLELLNKKGGLYAHLWALQSDQARA